MSFGDWRGLVAVAAYAPLLLWGPLLGGVTISYWASPPTPIPGVPASACLPAGLSGLLRAALQLRLC